MFKLIFKILQFYWPIILFIIFISAFFRSFKQKSDESKIINISVLGLISIPLRLKNMSIYRFILGTLMIVVLGIIPLRDYSFSSTGTYQFEVLYDEDYIEKLILDVKNRDKSYRIPMDWREKKNAYLDSVPLYGHELVKNVLGQESADIGKYLHSTGIAIHEAKFNGFFQQYKIERIEGLLKHEFYPPGKSREFYTSSYSLIPSDKNFINLSLKDFLKGTHISSPRIGQTLICSSEAEYSFHVIGLTKSRFFPLTSIDFSLFCFELNNELIPFSYAIYTESE